MTDEQKRQMVSAVLNAFIALLVSVAVILGYTVNYPQPVMLVPGGVGALSTNQKIVTDRAGQILYVLAGGKIDVNSGATLEIDSGATETHAGTSTYTGLLNANAGIAVDTSAFTVADTSGNTVIAGTLSVGGGYGTTGCSVSAAGVLQCDGALTIANSATITDTLNMSNAAITNVGAAGTDFSATGGLTLADALVVTSGGINVSNAVISNIGNASTDFDLSGGLTVAGGITGTVNTAAQTSITSLGTQAATLNMGNNVISNIGNASTDFDTSGGLTVAGGITGTVNTAAQTSITSVGTLSGLNVSGNVTATNFSGTLTTAAQPNVTSIGTQTNLTASNAITASTTLVLGTNSFTGAIKYGTSATYVEGTSITHGFATTPTVCLLTPMPITGTLTITTTGFSSDTGMAAVPIYWMCGQ